VNRGALLGGIAIIALAAGAAIGVARMRTEAPEPPAPAPAGPSAVITVTDAKQLEKLLADHHGPALIDFHAEWCKPCKQLAPRVEAVARARPQLLVMSVDVVASEALGTAFGAENLPLLVRLQDGKEVARLAEAPTQAELERWLDQPPTKP
jgi:thioredoxin-like negative regulator of GroEL